MPQIQGFKIRTEAVQTDALPIRRVAMKEMDSKDITQWPLWVKIVCCTAIFIVCALFLWLWWVVMGDDYFFHLLLG